MSHYKRHHPRRRRPAYAFDRRRVAIAKSRVATVSPSELLGELPGTVDPTLAVLLGPSMSPRIIC